MSATEELLLPVAAPPAPGLVLPTSARAWELRPGARVGARVVARVACGQLDAVRPVPVVRVWWEDGEHENAAPSIHHPWAQMDARSGNQPGARWLHTQCKAYARRHPGGWTLEGMRSYVLATLDAEREPTTWEGEDQ